MALRLSLKNWKYETANTEELRTESGVLGWCVAGRLPARAAAVIL